MGSAGATPTNAEPLGSDAKFGHPLVIGHMPMMVAATGDPESDESSLKTMVFLANIEQLAKSHNNLP